MSRVLNPDVSAGFVSDLLSRAATDPLGTPGGRTGVQEVVGGTDTGGTHIRWNGDALVRKKIQALYLLLTQPYG